MSEDTTMSININVYQVADFYADVFQVENNEMMIDSESTLDPDVIIFNNDLNRFDKLKENGQVEIEKMTRDFSQVQTHKMI
jgi:uncharacterized glyoxalase superfamily protein PhnB